MGSIGIADETAQKAIAITFIARLACHQINGPCDVCIDYVTKAFSDRAYPALRDALEQANRHGAEAGWGSLFLSCSTMAPNSDMDTAVMAPTKQAAERALKLEE